MDIFDILSKKIGYRRFSNREKILFVILILLFIEFLFYNFLIRAEAQKVSEVDFNESLKSEERGYKYSGLNDFSKENIDKISAENNLNRDNFTKEGQTDIETLAISGKIENSDISKISSFTNYYGYSNIELNRRDENTFTYRFKAEKPSKAIYYSDLKEAYFSENKEEKKNNEDPSGETLNSKEDNNTKAEEIKNTKAEEVKNSKVQKIRNTKAINPSKAPTAEKVSAKASQNKDNKIKGQEVSLSIFDDLNDSSNNKSKDKVESIFDDLDFENKKSKENKFLVDDSIRTNYYSESGVTSFYAKAENIYDDIKLGVEKNCQEISISILFPYDSCKEIGLVNLKGEKIPYTASIYQGEWFRINLFAENISHVYLVPKNNKDLFFFVKEVDYNEDI